ncbi:hypothetical protein IDJ77_11450 [Mucilaginibacter sp. ZT4R22]|uniref:SMODS-associating 2TM beta-strand rich effector domain-containing protein n=1 Tax=Mucilaginibacter pankratovii TaxID=2772110 RepID=A0ABR7WQ29_9SPHI|nr:hypothetical protein [Mucilaginibacter pankratovii]MBD1364424.1 hypothetical protein [Mucilaginibacter pankratovii]
MLNITIQDLVAIITIIPIVSGGAYFLIKEYKFKRNRYRQLLTGRWINEGSVGGPEESHNIVMDITVDEEDGSVIGMIEVNEWATETHGIFGLNGNMGYNSVKLATTVVRHGNVHQYDTIKLKFIDKRNLAFRCSSKGSTFFPYKTAVWKHEPQPIVHY